MPRFLLVLLVVSTTPVRADPATATAQLRARLDTWRTLADAPKAIDWRITYRDKRFAGDWVVTLGAYRYFIDHGTVRCQVQEDKYMTCGAGDSAPPRWTASPSGTRVTLATMKMLHRAVFHDVEIVLDDERRGHALVETLVTSPDAEERISKRYRANVTLTAESFAIGRPMLVEEFRETCVPINGCHSTHWSCHR